MNREIRAEAARIRAQTRQIAREWDAMPGSRSTTWRQVERHWEHPVSSQQGFGPTASAGSRPARKVGGGRSSTQGDSNGCSNSTGSCAPSGPVPPHEPRNNWNIPLDSPDFDLCLHLSMPTFINWGSPYDLGYSLGISEVRTEFDATVDRANPDRAANHEFDPDPSWSSMAWDCDEYVGLRDPVGSRLMLAVSSDGVKWNKTGMVIVNHGSVPCLAVEENQEGVETLYLFFCVARSTIAVQNPLDASTFNRGRPTPLAVAYTTNLRKWTYRLLGDPGTGFTYPDLSADTSGFDYDITSDDYSANDPSVIRAHQGRDFDPWYMFYCLHFGDHDETDGSADGAMILIAEAEHLYDFTWTTKDRVPVLPIEDELHAGAKAEDPSAFRYADYFYKVYAGGNTPDYNWKATAWDVYVVSSTEVQESCDDPAADDDGDGEAEIEEPILMNNVIDAPGTDLHGTWIATAGKEPNKYIVAIHTDRGDIASDTFSTSAGCNKIIEEDQDYEQYGIREAAVARFRGCWVMVYLTGIPPSGEARTDCTEIPDMSPDPPE